MTAAVLLALAPLGSATPEPALEPAPSAALDSTPSSTEKPEPLMPPLEPLPKPPSRELPPSTAEQRRLLDELLQRLHSEDSASRRVALEEIRQIDEQLLPAIAARIDQEAERANRQGMLHLLLDIRGRARTDIKQRMQKSGQTGEIETPDYLEMVLDYPKLSSELWVSLVHVLALSRMCVHQRSVQAVRTLIRIFVRFEFLRIDTQLQIKVLGDHALAALIETTRHPAPNVAQWAERQLDFLGKAIPGEAVQVEDPQLLADVLRAYGFARDPDSSRLIISFANSERSPIRQAAREAVVMQGELANWQLRDSYENMVGKRPPREWSWDRTARELFREFDRIRLAEVYTHYQRGLEARHAGNLEVMREAFDQVLTRNPEFEPRDEIVAGYLAYAEEQLHKPTPDLAVVLRRVERLAQDDTTRKRAESLLLTLQASALIERQLADQSLLQRALEYDSTNRRARELLDEVQQEPVVERSSFIRLLWPTVLGTLALLAALVVLLRRSKTALPAED